MCWTLLEFEVRLWKYLVIKLLKLVGRNHIAEWVFSPTRRCCTTALCSCSCFLFARFFGASGRRIFYGQFGSSQPTIPKQIDFKILLLIFIGCASEKNKRKNFIDSIEFRNCWNWKGSLSRTSFTNFHSIFITFPYSKSKEIFTIVA